MNAHRSVCVSVVGARLTPRIHEQFLVGSNGFLLEFSRGLGCTHKRNDALLRTAFFQVAFSQRVEPCKFAQVVTRHSLHSVQSLSIGVSAWLFLKHVKKHVNALQILSFVKENERSLPELLCVHRVPRERSPHNLGLPLLEGREFLVVLVEVLEQLLKHVFNVFVHPRTVLQLDDQIKSINHRQVLQTIFVFF